MFRTQQLQMHFTLNSHLTQTLKTHKFCWYGSVCLQFQNFGGWDKRIVIGLRPIWTIEKLSKKQIAKKYIYIKVNKISERFKNNLNTRNMKYIIYFILKVFIMLCYGPLTTKTGSCKDLVPSGTVVKAGVWEKWLDFEGTDLINRKPLSAFTMLLYCRALESQDWGTFGGSRL